VELQKVWSALFSRKTLIAAAAVALLLGVFGVAVRAWWLARQAVADSSQRAGRSSQLGFTFSRVASNVNSPFTSIAAAADYRTATIFEGDLFVCGKSALYRYSADGKLKQVWNAGRELPAASLVTVAVRRGTGTPELWIGTDGEGAIVFDNHQMRQFRPERPELRKVSALLGLGDGRMLLGTAEHGLLVTDTKQLSFFHPEFVQAEVTKLAGTKDALWVGTRKAGVWLWRAGEIRRFESDLPDPQVLSLETEGARAWVGTPLGVVEFTDGKFSRKLAEGVFSEALGLLPGTERREATGGTLAIGTMDEGVLLADLRVERPRPQRAAFGEAGSASTAVQSFLHTPQALLAVSQRTVVRLPDGAMSLDADRAGQSAPLSDGHVAALWADQLGNLWVGYFDRGLDIVRLNGNGPTRHIEDDHIFCVNRIKENEAGNVVAVATANGLALFDRGQQLRQILDRESGLIASHATDVLFHRLANGDSSMAVATPAGVSFVEGGSVSSIYAFQGLANNHVYTLAWRGDDLLAGTLGGFSLVRNGLVTASFTTANSGLHQNWITASAQDASDVYLGTYGSGVLKLTAQGALEQFAAQNTTGVPVRIEINPNALWVTASGVYAGTASQGLAVLKKGSDRWRFVAAGLPSLNVTAIAGRDGVLYIGTENGLVKVSESALP
jgi:ligand-binding sensor domain-containing protein